MRAIICAVFLCVGACSQAVGPDTEGGPEVIGNDNLDRGDVETQVTDGVDEAVDWDTASVITESEFYDCPMAPEHLVGDGLAGTACNSAADCKPVCCSCPQAAKSYLAAACVDGFCTAGRTCTVAEKTDQALCSDDLSLDVPDFEGLTEGFL